MNFLKILKIELLISIRYLQSRNKEKFISINSIFCLIGITIGVAALIVVMSIMNGFHEELSSKIRGLNSDIILNKMGDYPINNYEEIISKINTLPETSKTFGVIQKQGLITHKSRSAGVIVKSMDTKSLLYHDLITNNLKNQDLTKFSKNHILIGNATANILRVKIGDKITLLSPEFNTSFFGKMPKMKDFIVTGIFRTGLTEYDESTVFIPLKIGQLFYDMDNSVNQIEVFLKNYNEAPKLAVLIYTILKGDFIISDWQKINQSLFNALKTERVAMFTILTLIIIVAAFNIVSSLTMLVIDKSKEIAILKTIGMQNSSIIRIFFFCGFIISSIATFFGIIIGLAISCNIQAIKEFLSKITNTNLFDPVVYYLDTLPSKVELSDVANISILVFILTIIATLYPANKAGNLNPVNILKSE